ncbi:sensor histidine kinase [Ancylobacter aquaticus]|uniref:sensor histidine kinase n=1 Tax=Ancylobacter aquaticus TaxID=100 RepID=UPI001FE18772|nr:HWE histidine kinase domain-containing protein [Ancylobacter aquaticus]
MYITDELSRRPSTAPDYLKEKRAIQLLAATMANEPDRVLPRFVELAIELTGGSSAGLSLYEPEPAPGQFRWAYLKGVLSPFDGATTPRDFSPCGVTLDENRPVLSLHPERIYDWISDAGIVVPEVLLVPLHVGDADALGTLWIVSEQEGHFNSGHSRIAEELAAFVSVALQMLRSQQRLSRALDEQETLTREMGHRIQNLFAMVSSILRNSARMASDKEDLAEKALGRLHALSTAHGLVRRTFATGDEVPVIADVRELILAILAPHDVADSRFDIRGPSLACGERAINGLALTMHELATNSTKYGALSSDEGKVEITWAVREQQLELDWQETGGPSISGPPSTSGFGSKLAKLTIERQFGGSISYDWRRTGLAVRLSIPIEALTS